MTIEKDAARGKSKGKGEYRRENGEERHVYVVRRFPRRQRRMGKGRRVYLCPLCCVYFIFSFYSFPDLLSFLFGDDDNLGPARNLPQTKKAERGRMTSNSRETKKRRSISSRAQLRDVYTVTAVLARPNAGSTGSCVNHRHGKGTGKNMGG